MYGPRPIRFPAHWCADYSKYRGFLAGGISTASSLLPFFGTLLRHPHNTAGYAGYCYSFHRTKLRLVTSICRGPGPVATRMLFFSPKFKSAANFSAPAQEGNLFFLSGRSARKKIHNFPFKSSHLWRTSRHVWLLSSACDHCCGYQLICIITISTYTTGARAEMTRQLGFCAVK